MESNEHRVILGEMGRQDEAENEETVDLSDEEQNEKQQPHLTKGSFDEKVVGQYRSKTQESKVNETKKNEFAGISTRETNDKEFKKNEHPAYAEMSYHQSEGSFILQRHFWDEVWDRENCVVKDKMRWTDILKQHVQDYRPKCKINIKTSSIARVQTDGSVTVYAYARCGTGNCKHYSLKTNVKGNDNVIFVVHSAGKENHENSLTKTCQVRGADRLRTMKEVKDTPAMKHKLDVVHSLNPCIVDENNWQRLKSDAVIRKIRSEAMAEFDLSCDDYFDVVLRRREEQEAKKDKRNESYIQMIAEPFTVHLYSYLVLTTLFHYLRKNNRVTAYFDATGSVVRSSVSKGKPIYLYSCVVNINSTLVPLFNLLTCQHDYVSIGSILSKFRYFCESEMHKKWPVVGRIVVDCSYAIINALMRSWNTLSLQKYLDVVYFYCEGKFTSSKITDLVVVRLCKNHWTKMVCSNLKGHLIGGHRKSVIVEAMLQLMNCRTLAQLTKVFEQIVVILKCPVKHSVVINAFQQLNIESQKISADFEEPNVSNIAEELNEHDFSNMATLSTSKFHVHLQKAEEKTDMHIKEALDGIFTNGEEEQASFLEPDNVFAKVEKDSQNPFYCPQFLKKNFYPNHYAALIPLWTCLLDNIVGIENFSASNATVEGYFKQKKKYLHPQAKVKPGRFIADDKKYSLAQAKIVAMGLRTDGKFFKDQDEQEIDDPEPKTEQPSKSRESIEHNDTLQIDDSAQGTWKDRNSSKFSYSKGVTIKRVSSKLHSQNDNCTPVQLQGEALTSAKKKSLSLKKGTAFTNMKKSLSSLLGSKESWKKAEPQHSHPPISCTTGKAQQTRITEGVVASFHETETLLDKVSEEKDIEVVCEKESPNISDKFMKSKLRKSPYRFYSEYLNDIENLSLFKHLLPEEQTMIKDLYALQFNAVVFLYEGDKPLYLQDLCQLLDDKALSSPVVDACLHWTKTHLPESTTFVGSHTDATQMFKEKFHRDHTINNKGIEFFEKILLPIHVPGHWFLVFVDFLKETFSVLDPAIEKNTKLHYQYFAAFQSYMKNYEKLKKGKLYKKLTMTERITVHQNDDFNCGLYIINYVKNLMSSQNCDVPFDPHKSRVQWAQRLMKSAEEDLDQSQSAKPARPLLKVDAFPNGLLSDPWYYAHPEIKSDPIFTLDSYVPSLEVEDMARLLNGKWLTNFTIDNAVLVHMDWKIRQRNIFIMSQESKFIMEGNVAGFSFLGGIKLKNRRIIMPIEENSNHFSLITADFATKTFNFIDPLAPQASRKYIDKFTKFVKTYNEISNSKVDCQDWNTRTEFEWPAQKDKSNCGIFVIAYALHAMGVCEIDASFDPTTFRNKIAKKLLQNAPIVRHICPKCGQDEYSNIKTNFGRMNQCEACLRWYHERCAKARSSRAKSQNAAFVCTLCKSYLKNH